MNYPEIDRLVSRYRDLSACRNDIERSYQLLSDNFRRGGMLLACGNGASGFTAEQLVTGLLTGYLRERPLPQQLDSKLRSSLGDAGARLADGLQGALPAMSLGSPAGLVSGIATGVGQDFVFAQQVYAYGREGDTLVLLADGDADPNALNALRLAGALGLKRIVLCGREPEGFTGHADCLVRVPRVTRREIQELHLPVCNTLVTMLEQEFFS